MSRGTQYHIEYLGQTYDTDIFEEISDEMFDWIRTEYFKRPPFDDVRKQLVKISNGGVKHDLIDRYYVWDLMAKSKRYHSKWSIYDFLNCKELVEYCVGKFKRNPKIYLESEGIIRKIDTVFRLAGNGIASRVSNFPIKAADEVLEKYDINGNYYDFSCGWGIRLLSALKHNINYFGTDPNTELCERLVQLASDYKEACGSSSNVDIRSCGSEVFIPEWQGIMGIAFSSPPYYCLEDYRVGKQSYTDGMSYDMWAQTYLFPTIWNIYRYLVDGGALLINIKNFAQYDLVGTVRYYANQCRFSFEGAMPLKNDHRIGSHIDESGKYALNDNDEMIYIFRKTVHR